MNADSEHIQLRPTISDDLPLFYHFQTEHDTHQSSADHNKNFTTEEHYIKNYLKLLEDPTVNSQTIIIGQTIVGTVAKFLREDKPEVTYLIDRKHCNKGIATRALQQFLSIITERPVYGRVATDNIPSQCVLKKCGFQQIETAR